MDTSAIVSGNVQYESLEDMNTRYNFALMPLSILLGVFAIVGTVGNILVLAVFWTETKYRNTNFRVFVIAVAIVDLLTCLSVIPTEIAKYTINFMFTDSALCKTRCFFSNLGATITAFTLLIIAVDRFRKVIQPLKKQIWPALAVKLMLLVMVFSCVLAIPSSIFCGIRTVNKTNIYNTTTTVYLCEADQRYEDSAFRNIYKVCLLTLLFLISVCLIVMYTTICRTVLSHPVNQTEKNDLPTPEKAPDDPGINMRKEDLEIVSQSQIQAQLDNKDRRIISDNQEELCDVIDPLNSKSSNPRQGDEESHPKCLPKRSNSTFRILPFRRRSSSGVKGKLHYKILIWLILSVIFILTYFARVIYAFYVSEVYTLSPSKFLFYNLCVKLYFINNAINPVIYAWVDKSFQSSLRKIPGRLKNKLCCFQK